MEICIVVQARQQMKADCQRTKRSALCLGPGTEMKYREAAEASRPCVGTILSVVIHTAASGDATRTKRLEAEDEALWMAAELLLAHTFSSAGYLLITGHRGLCSNGTREIHGLCCVQIKVITGGINSESQSTGMSVHDRFLLRCFLLLSLYSSFQNPRLSGSRAAISQRVTHACNRKRNSIGRTTRQGRDIPGLGLMCSYKDDERWVPEAKCASVPIFPSMGVRSRHDWAC